MRVRKRVLLAFTASTLLLPVMGFSKPATITSIKTAPKASLTRGMTYYLPTRLLKVTVSKDVSKFEAVNAASDAAKKALSAATALRKKAKTADEKKAADDAVDAADGEIVRVKVAMDRLQGKPCVYNSTLELLPVQADLDYRFSASPNHSVFRDDVIDLGVAGTGLLTSAKATVVDRTSEIITQIAGAAASFDGSTSNPGFVEEEGQDAGGCTDMEAFTWVRILDPVHEDSLKKLNIQLANWGLRIDLEGARRSPLEAPPTVSDFSMGEAKHGALFYRTAVPVTLVVSRGQYPNWRPVEASIVSLPQAGEISYIPLNGPNFVKTVNDVTFSDGSITSWKTDNPSEVLAVVSLPVNILKSIVSIPGEIISVKVKYNTDSKALAEGQAEQIAAAERLARLKACLSIARSKPNNDAEALKCFE